MKSTVLFFWYFFNESSLGYQNNKDICEWITLSLSEDKKTITYTVTGNTSSEPRTAYFKLEFIFWETDGLSYACSDMITVTQNPSDKPVAITSPENIFLESNAEGIEGTLTTTIYNLPHKIHEVDFVWQKDGDNSWIEANYDMDNNTVIYKAKSENDTNQPRTAHFQLQLRYHDNNGTLRWIWGNHVRITQPAAAVLKADPLATTMGNESQKTAKLQISATNIDWNNTQFSKIKWLKGVQGGEISKPDWIEASPSDNLQEITVTTLEENTTDKPRTAYFKLFLKHNEEEICTDLLSVTQNPSTKPELTYTPSELGSNAEGITGTLMTTAGNYELSNLNYRIRWYTDATGQNEIDRPNWIDIVDCSKDRKTFTYKTLETNESNQPREAYLKIELYYPNDETDILSSNVATISQPSKGSTITISSACTDGSKYFGTYSSCYPFKVPEDLTFSEVGIEDGKLVVGTYNTGDIVPANTGVMVSAATPGDHIVTNLFDDEDYSDYTVLGSGNRLRPTGDEGVTAGDMAQLDKDCKYYRLTMHNGSELGFWWGASEGYAFDLAANKAYLAVPDTESAAAGFTFEDGGATVIEAIAKEQVTADKTVYNLNGQRVSAPTKGLYIVNGKKVIIQ